MDYYKILRVPSTASEKLIERQYHKLGSYYASKSKNSRIPSQLKTAYMTLSNPVLRSEYDRNLSESYSCNNDGSILKYIQEPFKLIQECYTDQTLMSKSRSKSKQNYHSNSLLNDSMDKTKLETELIHLKMRRRKLDKKIKVLEEYLYSS